MVITRQDLIDNVQQGDDEEDEGVESQFSIFSQDIDEADEFIFESRDAGFTSQKARNK